MPGIVLTSAQSHKCISCKGQTTATPSESADSLDAAYLATFLEVSCCSPSPPPSLWSITQTRATYGGLCGMPACGQAVVCGVCDTPELWRGAAGLCARVRACAGAAESLHIYIHFQNSIAWSRCF